MAIFIFLILFFIGLSRWLLFLVKDTLLFPEKYVHEKLANDKNNLSMVYFFHQ